MINLEKSFRFTKDLSALGCCDNVSISDIVSHSIEVSKKVPVMAIRLYIMTLIYKIKQENKRISGFLFDIESIIDDLEGCKNKNKRQRIYNELIACHDSMDNTMFNLSKEIIYSSIFIMIQSRAHSVLSGYPNMLYEHIYRFKVYLHSLNHIHEYDSNNNVFELDEFEHTERINMFVHHACGLRYSDTFNPYSDRDSDYQIYYEELERDIQNIKI